MRVQPGWSNRTPSKSVASVKRFWNVKYSFKAGKQTARETLGWTRMALISEAKMNTPSQQYQ